MYNIAQRLIPITHCCYGLRVVIHVHMHFLFAHGRSREVEKSDFRPGFENGPPLLKFYYEYDHFGARRV